MEINLFIQIIQNTPIWVFVLFFVLLGLGVIQIRDRTVGKVGVTILPCVLVCLSFYGVISAFGPIYGGMLSWSIGLVVAIWIGYKLALPKGVAYLKESGSFSVPGSWIPLALMMAIFFTKYVVGVLIAMQVAVIREIEFIVVVSCLYGCFSGLFFSRLLVIRKSIKQDL